MNKADMKQLKQALKEARKVANDAHYSHMLSQGFALCNGEWVVRMSVFVTGIGRVFQDDPAAPFADQAVGKPLQPVPLLLQAQELIHGQRQQDYGDKLTNFSQVSMMWQGYLAPKLQPDARLTPEDVTFLMILLKLARLSKSPDHKDSLVDVAGYAGCADYLQQERAEGASLLGALRDARG